jgi:hypothetical protein
MQFEDHKVNNKGMEHKKCKSTINGLKVILISLVIFFCLAFLLKLLYSLSIKDSLLWYVGIFFSFYIPGSLLLRSLQLNNNEYFINLFHSLALGAALMPLVYSTLRWISLPELGYALGIGMFLVWSLLFKRDIRKRKINIYTSLADIKCILILSVTVVFLLHLTHFTDVLFLEKGFEIRNIYLTETIFHLGVVNVLKDTFPPFFPYASGVGFSHYHLNMHLEIEMLNRFFAIDTIELTFFYFPLLYFYLLVCVPYMFVLKKWNARFLGILTGILMFGSGLSFIPGMLGMSPLAYPWTQFFRTTIWTLFCMNGHLPALFILFLSVFYLKKYYEEGTLSYLVVFALLGFSAHGFKTSMGLHIMVTAFLTGIASMVLIKDLKKGKLVCTFSALIITIIAIDLILFKGNPSHNVLRIDLFNNFTDSLEKLGLSGIPWLFLFLMFPLYVVLTFGTRALGFYVLKGAIKKKTFDPIIVFLLVFIVTGFILSESIFLGVPYSKIGAFNNAGWFAAQSLMAAWLLLSFFLARLRNIKMIFLASVIGILLLSAPSTVQFLTLRFDKNYYAVDKNAIEVVKYLETTPPKSIVLHLPNNEGPSLSSNLAGRASVLSMLQSYVIQTIGQKDADERLTDVSLFFNPDEQVNRTSLLKKYKVDYIYAPLSYVGILDREPLLKRVLKNSEYVMYRVDGS